MERVQDGEQGQAKALFSEEKTKKIKEGTKLIYVGTKIIDQQENRNKV